MRKGSTQMCCILVWEGPVLAPPHGNTGSASFQAISPTPHRSPPALDQFPPVCIAEDRYRVSVELCPVKSSL